jgi:hypothetical protein
MILNETTVIDVLKEPKSTSQINSVKQQESQLRVFTEEMSEAEIKSEHYWIEFQKKMKARSQKKFDRVIQFARFPLPVVQLCDSILNDFFKVFEGKNKYFNVDGDRDVPRLKEWIEENKPSKWIENESRIVFKNKPSSFVVVDRDDNGNPYLINICADRLIDAEIIDDAGHCGMIAFIHSQKPSETKAGEITTFYSVYDEKKYFVYSKDSNIHQNKRNRTRDRILSRQNIYQNTIEHKESIQTPCDIFIRVVEIGRLDIVRYIPKFC